MLSVFILFLFGNVIYLLQSSSFRNEENFSHRSLNKVHTAVHKGRVHTGAHETESIQLLIKQESTQLLWKQSSHSSSRIRIHIVARKNTVQKAAHENNSPGCSWETAYRQLLLKTESTQSPQSPQTQPLIKTEFKQLLKKTESTKLLMKTRSHSS